MRITKRILLVAVLAIPAFFTFNLPSSHRGIHQALAQSAPTGPQAAMGAPGKARSSRAPEFVSVQMKEPLETLIAGETGSFQLQARLTQPEGGLGVRNCLFHRR